MWPYNELGIDMTADERAIKRAYAVKLKQSRPDENPEGFQRLHEAFKAALDHCQAAATLATRVASTPAATPLPLFPPLARTPAAPTREPVPPVVMPAQLPFDGDAFVREAIAHADANEPATLRRWLEGIEALWSLALKTRTGRKWLDVVYRAAPPMPHECFDEMMAFFGLDHAGAVPDPLALQQRRQRMHLSWYLAPERRDAAVDSLGVREPNERKRVIRALDRLQRPFRWPAAMLQALWPKAVRNMLAIIVRLAGQPPIELPPPMNPRQQAFWLQAARGGLFSRTGLPIAGTRVFAGLFASFVAGVMLASIVAMQGDAFNWRLVGITIATGGALCALALTCAAWSQFTTWQRRFVPVRGVLGWLHFALVPAMTLGALVVVDATYSPMLGWLLALPALWLALARLLHGRQWSASLRSWLRVGIFLIYPVARLIAHAAQAPVIMGNSLAAGALLVWGIDAWRRRPVWRRAAG